jgi:hypothetical protein
MLIFIEFLFFFSRDGIYPSWNCSFDVYEGAQHNLPDQAAMNTAQRIQTMISKTMCADDILLVLISGKVVYIKINLLCDSFCIHIQESFYRPNIGPGFSE